MKVDREAKAEDLHRHPEVFAEMEQISMRLKGDGRGYEKVKSAFERDMFRAPPKPREGHLGYAVSLAEDCPRVVRSLLNPSS